MYRYGADELEFELGEAAWLYFLNSALVPSSEVMALGTFEGCCSRQSGFGLDNTGIRTQPAAIPVDQRHVIRGNSD
jgi:hypothetical protein